MKSKSLFYKIYFGTIIGFCVLLAAGLLMLNSWLIHFEKTKPIAQANLMLEEYIAEGDIYTLKEKAVTNISDFESEDALNSAFKNYVNERTLTISSSAKKIEGYELFNVKADDEKVMTLYLKPDEKAKRFGTMPYVLDELKLGDKLCKSVTINFSGGTTIFVNGIKVENAQISDSAMPEVLGNSTSLIKKQNITVSGLIADPVITAKENDIDLTVNQTGNSYWVSQHINETDLNKINSFSLEATQAYAKYMQNHSDFQTVSAYLDTTTQLYKQVRSIDVSYGWEMSKYSFENTSVSETHKYSENLFSCRVKFTQVLTYKTRTYADNFDKYVYLKRSGNSFKIIDMQSIGE